MEIVIKCDPKEIADLITEVCDRQNYDPNAIVGAIAEEFESYLEKCSNSRRASFSE